MKRTLIIFLVGGLVAFFILKKMRGIAGTKAEKLSEVTDAL